MVQRDLDDASFDELSTDRRLMIVYDGALTLATIPLFCAGFETREKGHHWMTFKLLPEVMGDEYADLADYLDLCRTKRNVGAYDRGGRMSKAEVEELILEVLKFQNAVLDWLRSNHPELV